MQGIIVFATAIVPDASARAALAAASAFFLSAFVVWFVLAAHHGLAKEVRDLWGLAGIMVEGRVWPAPGGWALSADAISLLHVESQMRGLRTFVELGPGASSVILGRSARGKLQMFGLEHEERYAESLRWQLQEHGMSEYTLVYAPLKKQMVGNRLVTWYDPAALARLPTKIDVLVVDGPPSWAVGGRRDPAWPLLRNRMAKGSLILVDDTVRPEERAMVHEWMKDGRLRLLVDRGEFVLLEVQ